MCNFFFLLVHLFDFLRKMFLVATQKGTLSLERDCDVCFLKKCQTVLLHRNAPWYSLFWWWLNNEFKWTVQLYDVTARDLFSMSFWQTNITISRDLGSLRWVYTHIYDAWKIWRSVTNQCQSQQTYMSLSQWYLFYFYSWYLAHQGVTIRYPSGGGS